MSLPASPKVIARLIDQHAAALELYAAQWSTAPADCVQEAFIELTKLSGNLPAFPTAWLYRTVRNKSRNAARAQRRREHHEQIAARLYQKQQKQQLSAGEKISLTEALDRIEPLARETVVLRIWSNLTWQQIADLTHTSSSSAQRNYVIALERLRHHLEPSCLPDPIYPKN